MTDGDVYPRYSLANERTFLAWIRTSLALLAGSAGLVAIALPRHTFAERGLAVLLALAAAASACIAWDRWQKVEAAIRDGRPAPPPRVHAILAVVVGVVSMAVIVLVLGSMARFGRALNRGGSQRATDPPSVAGRKSAGQRAVSSAGRSCRQRIALTLKSIGAFPMTHHVECVALLEKNQPSPVTKRIAIEAPTSANQP